MADHRYDTATAIDRHAQASYKAQARIQALEEALRPFAELGKELPTGPDWELDDKPVWSFNNATITLGELRRAKELLPETT